MKRLWPLARHHSDEGATSLLSRLASLHMRVPRSFCRDLGLDFQGIVDGVKSALSAFASAAEVSLATLEGNSPRKTEDGSFNLCGEHLKKQSLRRSAVYACPLCLAEDLERESGQNQMGAYLRSVWSLDVIRTCSDHGVALELVTSPGDGDHYDFAHSIASFTEDEEHLRSIARPATPSNLETYVLNRLKGHSANEWLDSFPLYAAIDACETVGAVALHGPRVRTDALTFDDWRAAGDAGIAVAETGATGVTEMLTFLDETYAASRASTDGPQARYGTLHIRLAATRHDPGTDKLRDVVAQHIARTTPVGSGDSIFGKPFKYRLLHSIRSASLEFGIHPKRLRKILVAAGAVSDTGETDERTTFPADRYEALLKKAADSLSLTEAETYLNAGRVHAKILADEGFIKPFVTLPAVTRGEKNFARADLDKFMATLVAQARDVVVSPEGAFDIPAAAKRANCGAGEIIELVLTKKLGWVGRNTKTAGFLSVLVDLAEVKRHVHGPARSGLTGRELERRLGTTTKVVAALLNEGILPSSIITNPVHRCPTRVVEPEDLEKFENKYVSLNQLAREQGCHFTAIRKKLAKAYVRPALPKEKYHATFYHRSQTVDL